MILLVSQYKYPAGDAGSLRFHSIALALKQLGYRTKVIGYGEVTEKELINDSIPYLSVREKDRYKSFLKFPFKLASIIKNEIKKNNISHIIAGQLPVVALLMVKKICKHNNIKLIYDVVEWYSVSQFKLKFLAPQYIENYFINTKIIDKSTSTISISEYLKNYFGSKGIRTVRIPIFFEQPASLPSSSKFAKINISYAGSPGKKDFLWIVLKGMENLRDSYKKNLVFHIMGCSDSEIGALCKKFNIQFDKIKDIVKIYGRIPHDEVIKIIRKSHFTILLRDAKKRYSKAGFPSKVIESISNGIPPIMNLSSDLGLYFKDNENFIEVKDFSVVQLQNAIEKALDLSAAHYEGMAQNTFALAIQEFSISANLEKVSGLL